MNYKWVLLFLVHASKKQTRTHVKALLKILQATHYNEEVKVLVLYSGLQNSIANGYRYQLTLQQIIRDEASHKLFLQEAVPAYGNIDVGDDKKMNEIFAYVRKTWVSDRFILFTWDHGSGFGIFKTDPRERDLAIHKKPLNFEMAIMKDDVPQIPSLPASIINFDIVNNGAGHKGFMEKDVPEVKKVIKKKTLISMLTNDELRNVIQFEEGTKKVDLLIMMNCAMQMIETGYALHDAAEYLIAPETCIFWAGYNYKAIINLLCANPDIDTEAVGKYAINTIKAYYENTPSKAYFKDLVVSMVKPGKAVAIKNELDKIALALSNAVPDKLMAIKKARKKCNDLTAKFIAGVPYHYVDLLNCVAALATTSNKINLSGISHAVNEYVVGTVKGDNYLKVVNKQHKIGEVNGCSIYFPLSAGEADADLYYDWFYKAGNHQTAFARDGLWKNFLMDYFKQDRKIKEGDIM